jgi:hypothetical protein
MNWPAFHKLTVGRGLRLAAVRVGVTRTGIVWATSRPTPSHASNCFSCRCNVTHACCRAGTCLSWAGTDDSSRSSHADQWRAPVRNQQVQITHCPIAPTVQWPAHTEEATGPPRAILR